MSFSVIYLIHRFFFRIWEFIYDWYVGAFRVISHTTISTLESFDRTFALKITLRHFFEPLYGDTTVLGYILGFFFRTFRVIIAGILYLIILLIGISVYITWALAPLFIIYRGIR